MTPDRLWSLQERAFWDDARALLAKRVEPALKAMDPDGTLKLDAPGDYDVALWEGSQRKVRLVFYRHQVRGTRNFHVRVRDQGSLDPRLARYYAVILDSLTHDCHLGYKVGSFYGGAYGTDSPPRKLRDAALAAAFGGAA